MNALILSLRLVSVLAGDYTSGVKSGSLSAKDVWAETHTCAKLDMTLYALDEQVTGEGDEAYIAGFMAGVNRVGAKHGCETLVYVAPKSDEDYATRCDVAVNAER